MTRTIRRVTEKGEVVDLNKLFKVGFSIDEIIDLTGLCRQTIYNEINAGRLKTFKVGRRRLVSPHALDEWVRLQEAATA